MISSVVLTFEPEIHSQSQLEHWAMNPAYEIGEMIGTRLPMTIEASSPEELESHTRRLLATQGVLNVDVVFVDLTNECNATLNVDC